MVVIRDGKEQTVKVTLGRLEDSEDAASADENPTVAPEDGEGQTDENGSNEEPPAAKMPADGVVLGMKLAALDDVTRKTYGISEDVEGVVITEVKPGTAAAERRLQPGDVIVEVAQEAMNAPEDVVNRVESLKTDGRRNALLMISNKTGELRFVTVRME